VGVTPIVEVAADVRLLASSSTMNADVPRGDAMPRTQTNLEIVLGDWVDALRRGDFEAITARLDPQVTWQGVRPELVCANREAVLDLLPRLGLRDVEAIELIGAGDKVVLGVRNPELQEVAGVQFRGQVFNVITLREGRIVRIQDYTRREDALKGAGAVEEAKWR
jgi:ketosteroid isomerase-like protein